MPERDLSCRIFASAAVLRFQTAFSVTLVYGLSGLVAPKRLEAYFMLHSVTLVAIVSPCLARLCFATTSRTSRFSVRQSDVILLLAICEYTTVQAEVRTRSGKMGLV